MLAVAAIRIAPNPTATMSSSEIGKTLDAPSAISPSPRIDRAVADPPGLRAVPPNASHSAATQRADARRGHQEAVAGRVAVEDVLRRRPA